jgi:hypothetical protein
MYVFLQIGYAALGRMPRPSGVFRKMGQVLVCPSSSHPSRRGWVPLVPILVTPRGRHKGIRHKEYLQVHFSQTKWRRQGRQTNSSRVMQGDPDGPDNGTDKLLPMPYKEALWLEEHSRSQELSRYRKNNFFSQALPTM